MVSDKRWDIFCQVIDNYGDIGICWRLAADLADRGREVRLWVDDPSALQWMAPGALQGQRRGVSVRPWQQAGDPAVLAALEPADTWVEAFGCELPDAFLAHHLRDDANALAPAWINLEYLTAESYAERAHRLPSPVMQGPAQGCTKHFFYPGFTPASGGLLREPDLGQRQAGFDRAHWLADKGIAWHGEQLVSLFCYEPAALAGLLAQWQAQERPTRLLVTSGRAAAAIRALGLMPGDGPDSHGLVVDFLPTLTQPDFDHLLWACDLNLVRGEDSVVRALWAGKPFIWQIYPQHDDAHHAKLNAFLDVLDAPASVRSAHAAWNGIDGAALPLLDVAAWALWAMQARQRLWEQPDLGTRLTEFVGSIRSRIGPTYESR
ncbi:elongation factor P maturation arginine rhamnosyltransferase EarP [Comamonadaceae bacterium G21597-S1]|nr:elongation factor P maturation arginine rhamnosyltransferase EarP [Comamonadaceae bacterium G21597-S1]